MKKNINPSNFLVLNNNDKEKKTINRSSIILEKINLKMKIYFFILWSFFNLGYILYILIKVPFEISFTENIAENEEEPMVLIIIGVLELLIKNNLFYIKMKNQKEKGNSNSTIFFSFMKSNFFCDIIPFSIFLVHLKWKVHFFGFFYGMKIFSLNNLFDFHFKFMENETIEKFRKIYKKTLFWMKYLILIAFLLLLSSFRVLF